MLPQKVDALFVASKHPKYTHKQRGPCRRSFSSFIEMKERVKEQSLPSLWIRFLIQVPLPTRIGRQGSPGSSATVRGMISSTQKLPAVRWLALFYST